MRVEIASDDQAELNSDLVVTLNPDTVGSEKYFVHATNNSATIFIVDDDAAIPELSVENISNPVAEGSGSIDFTILATADPERELTVYYTPSEVGQGDFLTDEVAVESYSPVIFRNVGGREVGTISVNLHNDNSAEPTGTIEITLNADSAPTATYTVVSGAASTGTATILDNDAPTLSVTGGSIVTELDDSVNPAQAVFTISSAVEPVTNNFTIQYTPTSSNFAINSGTKRTSHALNFADTNNDGNLYCGASG